MNFKVTVALLCCACFIKVHAIENFKHSKIQYADIATQLVCATTLDDAKNVLDQYNPHDQTNLCDYLVEQQKCWFINHDLFDYASLTCDSRELLKCACAAIGMSTIHFSLFIKYVCLRHNSIFFKGARLETSPKLMHIFYKLIAWAGDYKDPLLNKRIDDFKRIEELLFYVKK